MAKSYNSLPLVWGWECNCITVTVSVQVFQWQNNRITPMTVLKNFPFGLIQNYRSPVLLTVVGAGLLEEAGCAVVQGSTWMMAVAVAVSWLAALPPSSSVTSISNWNVTASWAPWDRSYWKSCLVARNGDSAPSLQSVNWLSVFPKNGELTKQRELYYESSFSFACLSFCLNYILWYVLNSLKASDETTCR